MDPCTKNATSDCPQDLLPALNRTYRDMEYNPLLKMCISCFVHSLVSPLLLLMFLQHSSSGLSQALKGFLTLIFGILDHTCAMLNVSTKTIHFK